MFSGFYTFNVVHEWLRQNVRGSELLPVRGKHWQHYGAPRPGASIDPDIFWQRTFPPQEVLGLNHLEAAECI
jgi:hypothetical protein